MRYKTFIPVGDSLPVNGQHVDVLIKSCTTAFGKVCIPEIRTDYIFISMGDDTEYFQERAFFNMGLYEMTYHLDEDIISHWAPK